MGHLCLVDLQFSCVGSFARICCVGELAEKVTKDGVTSWKHYVEAPAGTAVVYLR